MKRRLFLKSSVSSAIAAPALAQTAAQANAIIASENFYDARFADARRFAQRLFPATALTPVNGDLSSDWVKKLTTLSPDAISLRGVTTESFYFCLKTLLQPRRVAFAHIERVSRDLYAWEIRTTNKDGMA